ncbi:hypothetical protein [Mucilaginibacter sp.]|uniref:hypothetical protein n=1 Tax=Mucilaginibacter sp. TaxID=1882438 RepID=UPI0025CF3EDA|nr:hypothetical protein [Mucilaginibacter sp.]
MKIKKRHVLQQPKQGNKSIQSATAIKSKPTNFKSAFKAHWTKLLFLIIVLIIVGAAAVDYFTPQIQIRTNSINYPDYPKSVLSSKEVYTVRYETRRAFIPNEKILISVKLTIYDSSYQRTASKYRSVDLMLYKAILTDNSLNDSNRLKNDTISYKASDYIKKTFKESYNDGIIRLKATDTPNCYSGSAEVFYRQPGKYYIVSVDNPTSYSVDEIIIEGSSIEIMNKKNNDYFVLLGAITIIFTIYQIIQGFKRKE